MTPRTAQVTGCRPARRALLVALCAVSAALVTDGTFAAPPIADAAEEHATRTRHVETHSRRTIEQPPGLPPRAARQAPAARPATAISSAARPPAAPSPLPARHNGCGSPLRC